MIRLPTRAADWRLVARTIRLVLGIPAYAVAGVVFGLVTLTGLAVSLNLTLVGDVVVGGSLPLGSRLRILAELYPFVGTSFGVVDGLAILLVATLVGVDLALLVYHLRRHDLRAREGAGGTLGVLLGILGAGCAACGSAILAGVLSLLGVTGGLAILPLEGLEFALLSVGVLLLSIFWIADGMRGGTIRGCPVDP